MLNLGVNIDHVATLRQARQALVPDPVAAALICEEAGAWGITAHLREDRRHIQDADMTGLKAKVKRLNMEMAVTAEMLDIAAALRPHSSCLVPERRAELTTEGGLNVAGHAPVVANAVRELHAAGIVVSLFIDPEDEQIRAAAEAGSDYIEMHTGRFSNTAGCEQMQELDRLIAGAELAHQLGLKVNAGHGIDYINIAGILRIPHLNELNIGHAIIARSVFAGLHQAVAEMVALMRAYQK